MTGYDNDLSKEQNTERVGPFKFEKGSGNCRAFADMLVQRFEANKAKLNLVEPINQVELEEVDDSQAKQLVDLLTAHISPSHRAKFGVIIKGAFRTSKFDEMPSLDDPSNLVVHGTDASRGTKILAEGLQIPPGNEGTKVDKHPMYGVGICTSPLTDSHNAAGKAIAYFGEGGYSTSKPQEGIVMVLNPDRGNVYRAPSALWGNAIYEGDQKIDWRTKYDSVEALPRGDGGDDTAANFPELTLKKAEQAHPVAVLWAEIVPVTDPRYHQLGFDTNPVSNQLPLKETKPQPLEATQSMPQMEEASQPEVSGDSPPSKLAAFIKESLSSNQAASKPINAPSETLILEKSTNKLEIDQVEKQLGVKIVRRDQADQISATKISHEWSGSHPEGIELAPGQALLIDIPGSEKGAQVRNVVIQHRKHPSRWYNDRGPRRWVKIKPDEIKQENGITSVLRRTKPPSWYALDPNISYLTDKGGFFNERDKHPAKTEIYVHDRKTGTWTSLDTKIGEPRPASEPEEERLYDIGYTGSIDAVLLVGRGQGDPNKAITNVHKIELINYPETTASTTYDEKIFTRGVIFKQMSQPQSHEAYKPINSFGQIRWGYPNAIRVGAERSQPFNSYPEDALNNSASELSRQGENLSIQLKPGKVISGVEVACGDTVFGNSVASNKVGWAELNAWVVNAQGQTVTRLIRDEAVPPYGILSGGADVKYTVQPGDRLVFGSETHPAWILGLRVQYD